MSLLRLSPALEGGAILDTSKTISQFGPEDHGLLSWSFDPSHGQAASAVTAGTLNLIKVKILAPTLVTNIHLFVGTAGATLTANQCFAGLYSASGAFLMSATAQQASNWNTTGLKTMALTTAQQVNGPYLYVGFYSNGTTQPSFLRANSVLPNPINVGLVAPNFRYATANTGLTTALPGSFGTQTTPQYAFWAALS